MGKALVSDEDAFMCKPDTGQMYGQVGCGIGFDRVCVQSSSNCAWRWVNRVVDVAGVMLNVYPGVGTAINKAAKSVTKSLDGADKVVGAIKGFGVSVEGA